MPSIEPATFDKVEFEQAQIAAVFDEVVARVPGLPPGFDVSLVIDQERPTTTMTVASLAPCILQLDSGALENTKQPRTFGVEMASASLARLLFEVADRLDDGFGAPPIGEPSDLAQRVAWDVYCYGRVSRLGYRIFKPKHLYNFRNRHGFTDDADASFERLWAARTLTWAEIQAECPALS